MTEAFLGLGSNLGDRLENLQRATDLLASRAGIRGLASSRVYETEPVGPPQPDYLNAVVRLDTTLTASELLEACLSVEAEMGRVRSERWGPRVIDVDLLSYDREELDEPGLQIPHPMMHERAFVLVPLLELADEPHLPGGRAAKELRLSPGMLEGVRLFAPPLRTGPS